MLWQLVKHYDLLWFWLEKKLAKFKWVGGGINTFLLKFQVKLLTSWMLKQLLTVSAETNFSTNVFLIK